MLTPELIERYKGIMDSLQALEADLDQVNEDVASSFAIVYVQSARMDLQFGWERIGPRPAPAN